MVLGRAARDLGAARALEALTPAELRAWLVGLRATLSPISVAGYVRGLKAFAGWRAAEQVADPKAVRGLRRPRVPHKLVEPLSDEALQRLLHRASVRDRAIVLLFFDTGLRLSELAGLRPCDLRPDGSAKVMGKGARERTVPIGAAARQALLRYTSKPSCSQPRDPSQGRLGTAGSQPSPMPMVTSSPRRIGRNRRPGAAFGAESAMSETDRGRVMVRTGHS